MTAIDVSNYSGLQDAVARYLHRKDLSDYVPNFIQFAHAKLNRELRVREMQVRAVNTSPGDYIPVPDDFLSVYSLELQDSPGCWGQPLAYVNEERAKLYRAQNPSNSGFLRYYTIYGNTFELIPAQSDSVTFQLKYFQAIPALVNDDDSNWLLDGNPDLYVVSSALEAAPYLKEDPALQRWAMLRQQIMDAMSLASERALKPQSASRSTPRTFG